MKPSHVELILANIRPDLQDLAPYSSARSLIGETANLALLDANEAPFSALPGVEMNRYPSQQPPVLVAALASLYRVRPEQLLIGRGADEAIDLLMRLFGVAGQSRILYCPPTFPMYSYSAILQGVGCDQVPLSADHHQLDGNRLGRQLTEHHYPLVFLCSPNNPTGNLLDHQSICNLVQSFPSTLFVVDETYYEYAALSRQLAGRTRPSSWLDRLDQYPNLIVLRTLSKSHGAAGLRCGVAIGHPKIIDYLLRISAPYPLPQPVIAAVLQLLQPANLARLERQRQLVLEQRNLLISALVDRQSKLGIEEIFPSDANFVLVRFDDAAAIWQRLRAAGVIVRDQSHQSGLSGCLRISAGEAADLERLLAALDQRPLPVSARRAQVRRQTKETSIEVEVDLDQSGRIAIDTGIGFFDHMLEQIARHGCFSLRISCLGDLEIDAHHSIEDVGIALGQALRQALGDKRGLRRYGFLLPMDEAQAQAGLDLSGRFALRFEAQFQTPMVGEFPTQMVEHFFYSLAENLAANLHLKVSGANDHHQIEALFKACGKVLAAAIQIEGDEIPSSKGSLA